nr:hypothetical protein [uncultured Schaedlerella sp.]
MKEIGGYIELDTFHGKMFHSDGIMLNCGRNALALILESRKIKTLWLPYFLCDSVKKVCKKYGVILRFYHIIDTFEPEEINLQENEWLYLVNYYGQIPYQKLLELVNQYQRIIIDNTQNYFADPIPHVDTIYSCRKYFGVSDGAILYTDSFIEKKLPRDESFERMHYILGRFERKASEFYDESVQNNQFFDKEPIKQMSKLTYNLLHGIDYEKIKIQRTKNAEVLHNTLNDINGLKVKLVEGAFMYPFMTSKASEIRKKFQKLKIYVPILWPNVLKDISKGWLEWKYAKNILPLPCDQRYKIEEMKYICETIYKYIE